MTDLSRRKLFGAAAATGLATAVPAHAACVEASEDLLNLQVVKRSLKAQKRSRHFS